jgi:hypothetical protein
MLRSFIIFRIIQFVLAVCLISGIKVQAQGGHYWTEQYGTRSILMGGSVIGGAEDLGAVFYNPGRLSLIENPAFLLSANLYQLETLTFVDALDEGKDLKKKNFGGVPGLVAGTFKIGFMPKHHFAYAVLTRSRMNYSFTTRTEKEGNIFEELPGDEFFSGRLELASNFSDEWICLSWSYPIMKNLSIGVTSAFTKSSSMKNIAIQLQLLYDESSQVAQLTRNRNVNFNHNGLLWKLGLAWETNIADLGLTITTPKIHLKGSGNFLYEDFLSGLPDSVRVSHFESSLQGDLSAKSKSPLSIGTGATFKLFGQHLIHVSGEWYSKIPRYSILSTNEFTGQSTGDQIGFSLYDVAEQVFNYGVGMEFKIREILSIYTSYSSDYSYVPSDIVKQSEFSDEAINSTFRADINHAGAGFVLKLKRADITLGTTYAWARETFNRPVDFPDEGEEGIFNSNDTAEARWNRWRFIFSFSFPFVKDIQKKLDSGD